MSPVLLSLIVILSRLTAPQCLYSLWDQSKSLVSTWRGHQTTYHQFLSVLPGPLTANGKPGDRSSAGGTEAV